VAAFLLLVLAVGGGVLVADLLRENTAAGEVTVLHQTVGGFPEGWLLAAVAGLGFAVAVLLVASFHAARRRARRGRRGRSRRGFEPRTVEPEADRERLLDEFFGPDVAPRHQGPPARPAHLRDDRRQGPAGRQQSWDLPERADRRLEPRHAQARQTARLHDHTDLPFPAREGRRR
jgi:hypothetical protein